jgi:hypothetical protein
LAISASVVGSGILLLRIDLDHPQLVGLGVEKFTDRRVLGEQAIPVRAVLQPDGAEQVRDRRRGEHGSGRDPVAAAAKRPELPGQHINGPDKQQRVLPRTVGPDPAEVHLTAKNLTELVSAQDRGRRKIWAHRRRRNAEVLPCAGPHNPVVDEHLHRSAGGVVSPELVQQLPRTDRVAVEQGIPRQQLPSPSIHTRDHPAGDFSPELPGTANAANGGSARMNRHRTRRAAGYLGRRQNGSRQRPCWSREGQSVSAGLCRITSLHCGTTLRS